MENAVDAIKMAFAIFVFVLAIGIAFAVFSQARAVADVVLFYTDKTNFDEYVVPDTTYTYRKVGIETVVPAVRRYIGNNEGYIVEVKTHSKTYIYDPERDGSEFLSDDEQRARIENDIKELMDKCKNATFKEYFSAVIYRGGRYEGVEKINTDEKVKITYVQE